MKALADFAIFVISAGVGFVGDHLVASTGGAEVLRSMGLAASPKTADLIALVLVLAVAGAVACLPLVPFSSVLHGDKGEVRRLRAQVTALEQAVARLQQAEGTSKPAVGSGAGQGT